MKKLFGTSLGHNDQTWFSANGRRLGREQALELIEKECNPYITEDDGGGCCLYV